MFTKYEQVINFLDGLGLFHMDLTLSRVKDALQGLSLQKLPFSVVQVVGTNGKGSTATFLESIARAHGVRTGLFTSPHFVSPKERVLCSGRPLDEKLWPNLANDIHEIAPNLTYFEFLTVLALLAFVQHEAELVIFEAGLGGKFDSTTAIARDIICLSPISMDHEAVLGHNLTAIAKDKAAAIGPSMSVYYAMQENVVLQVLKSVAKEQDAKLIAANTVQLPQNVQLGLSGPHQDINANLALAVWQDVCTRLKLEYDEGSIRKGLQEAFIPGRLQCIKPMEQSLPAALLLDGAHNEQGLQVLISALDLRSQRPDVIVFSCMSDKNMDAMLIKLKELRGLCYNCPLIIVGLQNNERALSLTERQDLVQSFNDDNVYTFESLSKALDYACGLTQSKAAPEVLICGSLYLLGEFFAMYPHYLTAKHNCQKGE